ncbi:hypothetical protein RRG08_005568 [Elysia crispata]|uniref:Uncharacterized protein n=1 Tax=Elysia crispata TaxID=231223 RepID=A0AAE1E0E3_9GAST|nr:hypothetical protein RRG08_005568 [Elysia crispata]
MFINKGSGLNFDYLGLLEVGHSFNLHTNMGSQRHKLEKSPIINSTMIMTALNKSETRSKVTMSDPGSRLAVELLGRSKEEILRVLM